MSHVNTEPSVTYLQLNGQIRYFEDILATPLLNSLLSLLVSLTSDFKDDLVLNKPSWRYVMVPPELNLTTGSVIVIGNS